MPFTPANAYRHWLNIGIRLDYAPNRARWVTATLGRDVTGWEQLDIEYCVAVADPAFPRDRWAALFEKFIDTVVADPAIELKVTMKTIAALNAMADRLVVRGEEDRAFAVYQRILNVFPDDPYTLNHYADGLLRKGFFLAAKDIYQRGLDPEGNIWIYINLAICHEQLGDLDRALGVLSDCIHAFPGDIALQQRFALMAERHLGREWQAAVASSIYGRYEEAQARVERASATVSALIAPVKRLPLRQIRSVAIIGNRDLPQCRFYRIDQKIEQMRRGGFEVKSYDFKSDIPTFLSEIYCFDAVLFYRVPSYFSVMTAICKANQLGLATFYDIDDLIFDGNEYPASFESYGGQISPDEYAGLKLGVPLFAHAMALCDFGVGSTVALAAQMRSRVATGEAFLHRNAFGEKHEFYASQEPRRRVGDQVTIFYGSGTKAHKEDFQELVEPALVQVVHRHANRVRIVLMGYVTMTPRLRSIEKNLTIVTPTWDVDEYWAILAEADINLAVLKPSLMADCKSEIKWLEAAMFAIPSVVSDTATYRDVIVSEETGLICRTPEEWTAALERLVADGELRHRIGTAARRQVIEQYGIASMADNFERIFSRAVTKTCASVRPKIVVVNVFYPPQAIGGATRVVHDNVRRLVETHGDRFDIEIFCTIEGGTVPYEVTCYAEDGVRVTGVTASLDPDCETAVVDEKMGEVFGRYLDRTRPALVHFHCIQRLTSSIVLATLERKIPYVISVHDGWWISDVQFLLGADGELRLFNYADPLKTMRDLGDAAFHRLNRLRKPIMAATKILAVSEPFAKLHSACGLGDVLAMANGVSDLPPINRTRSSGKVRLGFIGGLAAHKGYPLIKYALLSGSFQNLQLLVIDHAMDRWETRHEVWGTTEVEFRAKWPQRRVGDLYGSIDILLAPSVWPESYGLVTREALRSGCWVIASDRGSIAEYVVEGVNGFVVDVSNPDGLAAALLTVDRDPERYLATPPPGKEMRKASDQGDDLAALYENLLATVGVGNCSPR